MEAAGFNDLQAGRLWAGYDYGPPPIQHLATAIFS